VNEPRELSDEERRHRRRPFVRQLTPVAVVLLVVGALFADEDGALGLVGLVALAQGIGLAVALIGLAFGHNPIERR
jgi:hypothetical protein